MFVGNEFDNIQYTYMCGMVGIVGLQLKTTSESGPPGSDSNRITISQSKGCLYCTTLYTFDSRIRTNSQLRPL